MADQRSSLEPNETPRRRPALPGPELGSVVQGRYRYRLDRKLGSGGFGSVYLAQWLDAGRAAAVPAGVAGSARLPRSPGSPRSPRSPRSPDWVALKLLRRQADTHERTSLKRELAAMQAIDHDRIPRVYDWSLEGETPFVALDYYSAGSLADARAFVGRLDEKSTWRLMADLLSALCAAHRASILHLDVKPSNVLLDGNGGFVLADFGASHASQMSLGLLSPGRRAIGAGTHGYRAPEQDCGIRSCDGRIDLWGVGATAWSAYTGIDLNKSHEAWRNAKRSDAYGLEGLSEVRPHCPPELEEIIMGLLFIDPERRPGDPAEALRQLRAVGSRFSACDK